MATQGEVVAGALDKLRALLALVESGELPAETDQVAFLRGAVAVLEQVDPSTGATYQPDPR